MLPGFKPPAWRDLSTACHQLFPFLQDWLHAVISTMEKDLNAAVDFVDPSPPPPPSPTDGRAYFFWPAPAPPSADPANATLTANATLASNSSAEIGAEEPEQAAAPAAEAPSGVNETADSETQGQPPVAPDGTAAQGPEVSPDQANATADTEPQGHNVTQAPAAPDEATSAPAVQAADFVDETFLAPNATVTRARPAALSALRTRLAARMHHLLGTKPQAAMSRHGGQGGQMDRGSGLTGGIRQLTLAQILSPGAEHAWVNRVVYGAERRWLGEMAREEGRDRGEESESESRKASAVPVERRWGQDEAKEVAEDSMQEGRDVAEREQRLQWRHQRASRRQRGHHHVSPVAAV